MGQVLRQHLVAHPNSVVVGLPEKPERSQLHPDAIRAGHAISVQKVFKEEGRPRVKTMDKGGSSAGVDGALSQKEENKRSLIPKCPRASHF